MWTARRTTARSNSSKDSGGDVLAIVFPRDDSGAPYTGGAYYSITANTAGAQVKTGGGYFHRIAIGTAGSSDWTVTLYDGTSTSGAHIAKVTAATVTSLEFDIEFTTGLFAVVAGTTPGDATISFI